MRDKDCVEFLQHHLPRLGLRWAGYRKVRRTVCKRLGRRLREFGLENLQAYAALLEQDPEEWRRLEGFCRIPISRFYRDREVFETLARRVLPDLAQRAAARGDGRVRCWSAGCASGEEPYSLRIAWSQRAERASPGIGIGILATDAEPTMLSRAARACYGKGSLKDLPRDALERAFVPSDDGHCLRPEFEEGVTFELQDIRSEPPEGPFDLILCRNLVFTYFDKALQAKVLSRIATRLRPGGYLVIGGHERLPAEAKGFRPCDKALPIFRRESATARP
jgi:chemotaxis protein methyltransferase CheR